MEWNAVQYHTTVSSGSVTWLDKLHILIYSGFCWDTTNLEQLAILLLKCSLNDSILHCGLWNCSPSQSCYISTRLWLRHSDTMHNLIAWYCLLH